MHLDCLRVLASIMNCPTCSAHGHRGGSAERVRYEALLFIILLFPVETWPPSSPLRMHTPYCAKTIGTFVNRGILGSAPGLHLQDTATSEENFLPLNSGQIQKLIFCEHVTLGSLGQRNCRVFLNKKK